MGIKAINPMIPFWMAPDEDGNDGDDKTEFLICGLDGEQYDNINPHEFTRNSAGEVNGISAKGVRFALDYGLRGWKNFKNDQGDVTFHRKNFRLIPSAVRAAIATAIVNASFVSDEERKN